MNKIIKRDDDKNKKMYKWMGLFVIMVVLILAGPLGSLKLHNYLILIFLYMALGQMWNFLGGYAGLPSLGQQAFVGLGGYSIAVACQVYKLPISVGLLIGMVVCVVFALVISAPIFKMSGTYFTIGTAIVSELLQLLFTNWKFVNYGVGYNISVAYTIDSTNLYFLSMGISVVSIAILYAVIKSRMGLGLMAMRDNLTAAKVRGIPIYATKLKVFLISAAMTGLTGGALYLNFTYIIPSAAFSINWTIACVFMVIIGGAGTLEGPVLGAILYVFLRQALYDFPGYSMIILGVIAIFFILILPKGIIGLIKDKTSFDLLSERRSIKRRN